MARKPQGRRSAPNESPIGSELIVMTRPEAAFRSSAGRFAGAPGADVGGVADILRRHGAAMAPVFGPTEERVAARTQRRMEAAQAPMEDMTTFYKVDAPSERLEELRGELAASDLVEAAYIKPPVGLPVINDMTAAPSEPPPATADLSAGQIYLDAAPAGVDARWAWTQSGGRGRDIRIIDIEGDWRFTHEDLLQAQGGVVAGNRITNDISWRNHGTAVLGEYSGDDNGLGIIGIAHEAIASAVSHGGIGSAAAIDQAAQRLRAGDVMLLEMHRPGPRHNFQSPNGQQGYIAVEWWPDDFAAIRNAANAGIIVVEAAGNGSEDLDDNLYQTPGPGFPANWTNPFRRSNRDSGAIVVGAGAPPPGTHGRNHGPDRSRLDFSNWGALIDAQGWGREVTTCGYGNLQGGTNEDLWYTDTFSGTSSASPIVTGVIASIQGMAKARNKPVLTVLQIRNCLRTTGSPQQDAPGRPASQRIGNRPDLRAFATCAFGKGILKDSIKETGKELVKEGKEAFKEIKDARKELKEKEKEFTKELKDARKETKDKEFKEGKEIKEFKERKEGKEFKEFKEFKERDKLNDKLSDGFDGRLQGEQLTGADAGDPIEQRLGALEEAVQSLVHFIGSELRPDLSQSALQSGSSQAKDEKDMKDVER